MKHTLLQRKQAHQDYKVLSQRNCPKPWFENVTTSEHVSQYEFYLDSLHDGKYSLGLFLAHLQEEPVRLIDDSLFRNRHKLPKTRRRPNPSVFPTCFLPSSPSPWRSGDPEEELVDGSFLVLFSPPALFSLILRTCMYLLSLEL